MALIKCKECGKEISDKAKRCIHCGCPIEYNEESTNKNTTKEEIKVVKEKEIPKDKKDEIDELSKEDSSSKVRNLLLILSVVAIFIISAFFSSISNKINEVKLPVALEGDYGLKEITYDEYQEKIKSNKPFLIIIIEDDCQFCDNYISVVKQVLNSYRIPISYINIDKLTEEDLSGLTNTNAYLRRGNLGTPTTLLLSNTKVLKSIDGYVEKSELINFIKENITAEEDMRTPREKLVDYMKSYKSYDIVSCDTTVCNFTYTSYGIKDVTYYQIDFENKKYTTTTYRDGSSYYEYNYGNNTGYIKTVNTLGWTTTIEINITFEGTSDKYTMNYNASGFNFDVGEYIKDRPNLVIDLKNEILKWCDELGISISDL